LRIAAAGRAERLSARVVSARPMLVARSTPATEAPVSSRTPAMSRKTATMCAPMVDIAVATQYSSASPVTPPRCSKNAGFQ